MAKRKREWLIRALAVLAMIVGAIGIRPGLATAATTRMNAAIETEQAVAQIAAAETAAAKAQNPYRWGTLSSLGRTSRTTILRTGRSRSSGGCWT